MSLSRRVLPWLLSVLLCQTALAQTTVSSPGRGSLFGLDRYDEREDSGLLSRRNQLRLDALAIGSVLSVALWEGSDSALGRTALRTIDAMATTAVVTESMKRVFQRARPAESQDPNDWFAGSQHASFPSGETAMMAAFVTPMIIEHQHDTPQIWAMALLPVYMGRARMASQGHWLSDVLVGGTVGALGGWAAERRQTPLVLAVVPGGAFVGWKQRF